MPRSRRSGGGAKDFSPDFFVPALSLFKFALLLCADLFGGQLYLVLIVVLLLLVFHLELREGAGERVPFCDDFGGGLATEDLDSRLEFGREGRFGARGEKVKGLRGRFTAWTIIAC